jgi:NADH-quinone oxidoreductase subunit L
MGLATVAICGIFPFSGFFSKDEILWKVFEGWYNHGGYDGPNLYLVAWILGMLGAFCTAFYMTRLMAMTFWGDYRGNGEDPHSLRAPSLPHEGHDAHAHAAGVLGHNQHHGAHEPHEVSRNMWLPVAILAGLAVIGGFLNVPHSLHWLGGEHFSNWLSPLLFQREAVHHAQAAIPAIEYQLQVFSVLWAGLAMLLAWWIYKIDSSWSKAKAFVAMFPSIYKWVHNKYFVDELYDWAIINPTKRISAQLWAFDAWAVDGMVNGAARFSILAGRVSFWIDARIVDGLVNFVAWALQQAALLFRALQSGRVQHYAFVMFLAFLTLAFWHFLV